MTPLPESTQRRLKKIPQLPIVWEGDRRPYVEGLSFQSESEGEDCVVWLDGSEGVVRGMDMVSPMTGLEGMIRTLLNAIETPIGGVMPARPQKVLVRDREIQFFLRGVLQDLDIKVDYVNSLPLIDELFSNFDQVGDKQPPNFPPQYTQPLQESALQIWAIAPWDILDDHNIIKIEINCWGTTHLYATALGMLGEEYGILFYRSFESLNQFRKTILEDIPERVEEAFLSQDCWFITFEIEDSEDFENFQEAEFLDFTNQISFGSIHPYEGMRNYLDEEEALTLYTALKSLSSFLEDTAADLGAEISPPLEKEYTISLPLEENKNSKTITTKVSTNPDLEIELLKSLESAETSFFDSPSQTSIEDDLIPEDAMISIGTLPWEWLDIIQRSRDKHYQSQGAKKIGVGLPVVIVQTSRPKAEEMIEYLEEAQGVEGILFTTGEDPLKEEVYDLGILQLGDGELQLFGEFIKDDPHHVQTKSQWETQVKIAQGFCGLVIAKGVTGKAKGQPKIREMIALFEAHTVSPESLGLGTLELTSIVDLDFE